MLSFNRSGNRLNRELTSACTDRKLFCSFLFILLPSEFLFTVERHLPDGCLGEHSANV